MYNFGNVADYIDEPKKNLEDELMKKDKIIRKLKKKVKSCKVMVARTEYLQELCNEHEQREENTKNEYDRVINDFQAKVNIQSEKVKTLEENEHKWEIKYNELTNVNNCITKQLENPNCNEDAARLEKLETDNTLIYRQLCDSQCENENLKHKLDTLSNELNTKCKQFSVLEAKYKDGLYKINDVIITSLNKFIEESKNNYFELRNQIEELKENNHAKDDDWCLRQERDNLAIELNNKCKELSDVTTKYEDANSKFKDSSNKINILTTALKELLEGSQKNSFQLKNKIIQLEEMNRAKGGDFFTKHERDMLSNELNTKCKQLSDMTAKYKEASCKIKEGSDKINFLAQSLKELLEGSVKNNSQLKNKIKKLEEMNRAKENDLLHLKTKIKQLAGINERK